MPSTQTTTAQSSPVERYTQTHQEMLSWLRQLESHELGRLLELPQSTALSMAPTCLNKDQPVEERAIIIALLAAQMHPMSATWLQHISAHVEAPLNQLAEVARQQVLLRLQALALCEHLKHFEATQLRPL